MPTEGTPEGVSFETLNQVCLDRFGEALRSVSHLHISSWKSAGSYRLLLETSGNRRWSLIFKNATYSLDHIPALRGLPVAPGPPEYLVYSNARGALAGYLPEVYRCVEIIPGGHYQYLLEDLGATYKKAWAPEPMPEVILGVTVELSAVHRAMNEWSSGIERDRLLKYSEAFTSALYEYAATNLERYGQERKMELVSRFCELLPRVVEINNRRGRPECYSSVPIHGDFNTANILVHGKNPNRIKIVDWEWAGLGAAHADLASVLKDSTPEIEEEALTIFSERNEWLSAQEHRQAYQRHKLERLLFDAAFLAIHHLESRAPPGFLPNRIEALIQRLFDEHERLVDDCVR